MHSDPTETEIKLIVDPARAPQIARLPLFAHAKSAPRREHTTYFDTDDLALRRRGFSLRVRESGKHHVQTLKHASAGAAAVGTRNEWEWRVRSNALDMRPLEALAKRKSELDGQYAHAAPKFATDIRRKTVAIALEGGTKVEAAFDRGIIRAGDTSEVVSELEIEIRDGPVAPAYRLALALAKEGALRLGIESKADRGFRLITGKPAAAEKSHAARLGPRTSLRDAITLFAHTAITDFVANMPAAYEGDAEGVHQMRVALRRLRTLFVLFAPHLERNERNRFNEAIRKLGATLGAARDWDVFVLETLPEAACAEVPAPFVEEMRKRGQARRTRAHRAVRHLIEGPDPTELVLTLECWIADDAWRTNGGHERVEDLLPHLLDRLLKKTQKRTKGLAGFSSSELHPLRKSIKKLRYSAESCADVFGKASVSAYVRRCKKLHNLLGTINDAAVTERLLKEIMPAPSNGASARLFDWNGERAKGARKKLLRAWKKLEAVELFWQ